MQHHQAIAPIIRTSGTSSMPVCSFTLLRNATIKASISAAEASPVLTMKFACLGETIAPPTRKPFNPHDSINRAAQSPSGLRKHGTGVWQV